MKQLEVDRIIDQFIKNLEQLKNFDLIQPDQILNYQKASESSFHSLLQYCLIKSGIDCDFIAVPEYKLQLEKAIDKKMIDNRFKKTRKQRMLRADVAFISKSEVKGLAEVYTLDEIHGCQPSRELDDPWVTPYEKLTHLLNDFEEKVPFLILVNLLPQEFDLSSMPWYPAKQHSMAEWENKWKELAFNLKKKGNDVRMICIRRNGIDIFKP